MVLEHKIEILEVSTCLILRTLSSGLPVPQSYSSQFRKPSPRNELAAAAKTLEKASPAKPAKLAGLPPAGLSQATAQLPAVPEAAAVGGTIPIVMPEKLAKGRFLVELEAAEGGAADLAGDAGAVGRFSLPGTCAFLRLPFQE